MVVVRQPSARRRTRRRQRARVPRLGQQMGAPRGVALNYSMVPRSRIHSSRMGSDGFQVVQGTEVFCTVATPDNNGSFTNSRSTQGFFMNPMYPHFQRLSGLAQSFQKFRFREIEFTYHPACPTTRSGVCSLAFLENPLHGAPDSNPSYASYDTSFTGSIGIPMRTKVENQTRDPKWYYTDAWKSLSSDADPTAYQQGVVWISCSDAVTADLELLAGYVSMTYKIEFDDLKPVSDIALNVQPRDTTVSGGTAVTMPFTTWLGGLGDFGWNEQPIPTGAPSASFKQENFWLDAGLYTIANLLEWGAVTFSESKSPRGSTGRVVDVRIVDDCGRECSKSFAVERRVDINGCRLRELPPGFVCASDPCAHVRDGYVVARCPCTWWKDPLGPSFTAPRAANDVVVTWTTKDNQGDAVTVRTQTSSLGSSAATSRDMFVLNVSSADAPVKLQVALDTDGSETRSVTGATSYLTITGYEE